MRGAIGEEATGSFLATLIRREKAAKFAPTAQGQLGIAFIAEDMGPAAAGTSFSTWQNQVQGARITSAARQAQVKAGLATNGRWEGKGPNKKFVADTVDAELAQTDPLAYMRKRILPALKSMGMSEEQIFSNKNEDIALLTNNLRKLYSETNAANFAISGMNHLLELELKTRDAYTRDTDPKIMAEATKNSVQAATNAIQSSFQGIFGQAAVAIAPFAAPIADSVSSFMGDIANNMKLAGKGDPQAIAKLAAGAMGGIVAGGTGMLAMQAMAPTLGMVAGMQGLTSKDPGTQSLSAAGVSLLGAANALKAAAAVQAGGWGKLASMLAVGAAGAAGALGAIVGGTIPMSGPVPAELENATPEQRAKIYERDAAKYKLHQAKEALKQFDEGTIWLPPDPGRYKGRNKKRLEEQEQKNKLRLAEERAKVVQYIADLEKKVAEIEFFDSTTAFRNFRCGQSGS